MLQNLRRSSLCVSTIARLAWTYVPSEENNKVFGRHQSFVTGDATNIQSMVKDSAKYAARLGIQA